MTKEDCGAKKGNRKHLSKALIEKRQVHYLLQHSQERLKNLGIAQGVSEATTRESNRLKKSFVFSHLRSYPLPEGSDGHFFCSQSIRSLKTKTTRPNFYPKFSQFGCDNGSLEFSAVRANGPPSAASLHKI